MKPIDRLEAVLLDPDGEVCIHGSDVDRQVIKESLDQLRAEVERLTKLHASGRHNIEDTADGVKICRGLHDSGADCCYEYFIKREVDE